MNRTKSLLFVFTSNHSVLIIFDHFFDKKNGANSDHPKVKSKLSKMAVYGKPLLIADIWSEPAATIQKGERRSDHSGLYMG